MTCPLCGWHDTETLREDWRFCAGCGFEYRLSAEGICTGYAPTNHARTARRSIAPTFQPYTVTGDV